MSPYNTDTNAGTRKTLVQPVVGCSAGGGGKGRLLTVVGQTKSDFSPPGVGVGGLVPHPGGERRHDNFARFL